MPKIRAYRYLARIDWASCIEIGEACGLNTFNDRQNLTQYLSRGYREGHFERRDMGGVGYEYRLTDAGRRYVEQRVKLANPSVAPVPCRPRERETHARRHAMGTKPASQQLCAECVNRPATHDDVVDGKRVRVCDGCLSVPPCEECQRGDLEKCTCERYMWKPKRRAIAR